MPESALPQLVVKDTRKRWVSWARSIVPALTNRLRPLPAPVAKTTVKEVACILRTRGPVLATGNLNNDLGVPLTLLELSTEHTAAVIELGASRVGEIAYSVALTKPHVADPTKHSWNPDLQPYTAEIEKLRPVIKSVVLEVLS